MQEIIIGNHSVAISRLIGKGGEGEVYEIKDRLGQVVKIYHPDKRAKRESKVRAMISTNLASKTDLAAYPREVVTDKLGNFVGFVMQFVAGYRPLHELYSPKSRKSHFPNVDFQFIVRTAANIARAILKVHQTGCIIGDLNHSGVLVASNATVALIDADSFQFSLNSQFYPCIVGVPEFTPPELQGKNLASIRRTIEHDNFSLAVAIFHLLFLGRHPYAGCYKGPDISMGEAIARNLFAYSLTRQVSTQITPPPGALTLDLFPEKVAIAFENAFGLNPYMRPSAQDWIEVLCDLEKLLIRCSVTKTHLYAPNKSGCVWCALRNNTGYELYPDVSIVIPNQLIHDDITENEIRDILAFRLPNVEDLFPALPVTFKPKPSRKLRNAQSKKAIIALIGLLMISGSIIGFIVITQIWFVWCLLIIGGWSFFSDRTLNTKHFEESFKDADQVLQRELYAYFQRNNISNIYSLRSKLNDIIASYKGHDNSLSKELLLLASNRKTRQMNAYLDRFYIRDANIYGIGQAKTATLISFGIETAADIKRSDILKVQGFGEVMTQRLIDWRQTIESQFIYDPNPTPQDKKDEQALRLRFANEKSRLKVEIRSGLYTLRNSRNTIIELPSKIKNDSKIIEALNLREQAEGDLLVLGASVPVSAISLTWTPLSSIVKPTTLSPMCPLCGSKMQRRTGRYGQLWGCMNYPSCKATYRI